MLILQETCGRCINQTEPQYCPQFVLHMVTHLYCWIVALNVQTSNCKIAKIHFCRDHHTTWNSKWDHCTRVSSGTILQSTYIKLAATIRPLNSQNISHHKMLTISNKATVMWLTTITFQLLRAAFAWITASAAFPAFILLTAVCIALYVINKRLWIMGSVCEVVPPRLALPSEARFSAKRR